MERGAQKEVSQGWG